RSVGKGTIQIIESAPASRVTMTLHMLEPFETRNTVRLLLETQGDSTRVTWSMQGPVPYLSKIIHLFIDMDRMVGTQFEAGLAGFYMIEARDLNEAIQIAARIPPAQVGSVEVRPIRPIRETVRAMQKEEASHGVR